MFTLLALIILITFITLKSRPLGIYVRRVICHAMGRVRQEPGIFDLFRVSRLSFVSQCRSKATHSVMASPDSLHNPDKPS